jgi:HEPN domain-containing protein
MPLLLTILYLQDYHPNMKPETERWVEYEQNDLRAAVLALEHDFPNIAIFHCHEAVEKILKAIWVESRDESPERTHNLPYLARELGVDLSEDQREFLRKLYWQLIPSRYPEGAEPDRETVRWYYEKVEEIFSWLRQMLK